MKKNRLIKGEAYNSIYGEYLGIYLEDDYKYISGQRTPVFSKEGCICRKYIDYTPVHQQI